VVGMRAPVRTLALVVLLIPCACFQGGKVEASREHQERDRKEFEAAKETGCVCVSGVRCDSPGSGYPKSPNARLAEKEEPCCASRHCGAGLSCDPNMRPSICLPIDAVARRETLASCAPSAPKIWEQASPASCAARGRDAPGYEALRRALGPQLDRARYVTAADRATLQSIERGVLVVLSGAGSRALSPSVVPPSIDMLREVLRQVEPPLDVFVAEKRCLTQELIELLKLRCDDRGDGEVAWVRSGEVIATTGYGFHPEAIAPHTRRLLSLP
jgi:hypothetical protein